ncbi:MAG: mycothione reductase [Nocardioidaceae bacterium]
MSDPAAAAADDTFDVAVIGSGSGNSMIDGRFADRRVAILERGVFGGTCLNVGCIPTKMLVYPADVAHTAQDGPRLGVETRFEAVDWPQVRDRVFGRIDPISVQGRAWRHGPGSPNVTLFEGHARFVGDRTLDTGTGRTITADQVVIAAGSRPVVPGVPGLLEAGFHTSDTIMRLDRLPARLVVVGGGYVGAELAHVFASFGTRVTVVNRSATLLRGHDEDVAARFTAVAGRRWDLRLGRTPIRVERGPSGVRVHLDDGDSVEADELLVAVGRRSNADGLDLDRAGVKTDEDGTVVVDAYQRTTAEGVWALGDVAGPHQLKHVANHEARVVAHNLLHHTDPARLITVGARPVPHAVFSDPQIGAVGLTEREARERGCDVVTATQDYAGVAYGWAMEDTDGLAKMVVDRATGRILGAAIVGAQASNLVQLVVQAMSFGQTAQELARGQYWIHPALSEVVENLALAVETARASG